MEQSSLCEVNSHSANQEISPPFMEPAGSLPCSQETTTCLYPEPE